MHEKENIDFEKQKERNERIRLGQRRRKKANMKAWRVEVEAKFSYTKEAKQILRFAEKNNK